MSAAGPAAADIPFVKTFEPHWGARVAVSPLLARVVARNPGPFTYTGSGTYIVSAGGAAAVIDPGPDLQEHYEALLAALGGRRVSHVLVTHTHLDHCGLARRFADAVDAPVLGYGPHPSHGASEAPAAEEGGDGAYTPDVALRDGDTIRGEGWTIEAVYTPGHLSNHLCFALAEENALFSGDHVMGWSTTVVAPPDGSMADYLASLERLLARADAIYYPTHGAPILRPQAFVRAVRTHRLMRDRQILGQIAAGARRIPEIVAALYAGIDPRLHKAAGLNVLAHLIRLAATGAVAVDGPPTLSSAYAPSGRADTAH